MTQSNVELFKSFLAPHQISISPEDCAVYGHDWLKEFTSNASGVLFPENTSDVQSIIRLANQHKISLVPSGGRTGLSGGATACQNELIVSLEKMNRLLELDVVGRTMTVQAGIPTAKVQDLAAAEGLFFPIEFTAKGSSQIGGNLGTNAGGIRVVKYGTTREWVIGLTAVTGTGELVRANGRLVKNQTGYDLRNLLIGSEGTLAVITEVTLKLARAPAGRERLLIGIQDLSPVLHIFASFRSKFNDLSVFELFPESGLEKVLKHNDSLSRPFPIKYPWYLLIEIEGEPGSRYEPIVEAISKLHEDAKILDAVVAQSDSQGNVLLELRERIGEVLSSHYTPHKNDISVPVAKITDFLLELEKLIARKYPNYEVVLFGHVGDGNIHVNVLKPRELTREEFYIRCHELDNELFSLVRDFGGSISAEHGVGLLKKEFLHYSRSQNEIELMRSIKQVFDPANILNPGKVF